MESLDIKADNLIAFLEDVIGRDPNSSDNAHTKMIKPPPRISPIITKIHVSDHLYFLLDYTLLVTTLVDSFSYDILGPFDMIVAEYKSRSVLYACLMQSGVTLSGTKQRKYSSF